MKIDKDTVDRLAELAKLEFNDASKEAMVKDLTNMLAFIDQLNELDVEGVEPLIFVNERNNNVLREDKIEHPITQAEALKNAPQKDMYYFRVPKVIGQSE
jgi:aspartyl-tRNA(Asn)/glutamyl-tRNA(Gln) amidotransferase subunit C